MSQNNELDSMILHLVPQAPASPLWDFEPWMDEPEPKPPGVPLPPHNEAPPPAEWREFWEKQGQWQGRKATARQVQWPWVWAEAMAAEGVRRRKERTTR